MVKYIGGYMHSTVVEVYRDVVETIIWMQLHRLVCIIILALRFLPNNVRVFGTIKSVVVRHISPIKGFCCIFSCVHNALQHKMKLPSFSFIFIKKSFQCYTYLYISHFLYKFLLCLIRSVKEISPSIYQQLKLTICGLSTTEIMCCHGYILTHTGPLNK